MLFESVKKAVYLFPHHLLLISAVLGLASPEAPLR